MTTMSEQIVEEVAGCLIADQHGHLAFGPELEFLEGRLKDIDYHQQRAVVQRLTEFGYFLEVEYQAPEAGEALMARLQDILERLPPCRSSNL